MRREIVAAIAVFAVGAAYAQMPPNSFILRPAPSVEALAKQAKENPVVMDRYVRHFQMTPSEVLRLMNSLHAEALAEDTYFEVFNVPAATGELRSRRLVFKKGEKVFVDASGNPIIIVKCGNPIVRLDEADSKLPGLALSNPAGIATIEVPKAGAIVSNMALMQPAAPIAPDVTFEAPKNEGAVTTTSTGGAPFGGLALGLLPAIFIGLNSGGGEAVPEPSTIAALGIGVALLTARARRRPR